MSYTDFQNKLLSILSCALSTPEERHICEDPVILSCDHYVCKNCIKQGVSHTTIKCSMCDQINKRELNQDKQPEPFSFIFDQNLSELFKITYENLKQAFNMCKDTVNNSDERIDLHIEFVKEEIQIRIESIKLELDAFYQVFNENLDEIRVKWKSENKCETFCEFNEEVLRSDLEKLEKNIEKQQDLTKANLYEYQNKVKSIRDTIAKYNENAPKLEFRGSKEKLDKELIGELIFETALEMDKSVITQIKKNKYEQINLNFNAWDICELPNGNIMLTNYNGSNIMLYNKDMQFIKTIATINGRSLRVIGVTTNGKDAVFMCDWNNNSIVKTDLDINQIASFGNGPGQTNHQLCCPAGVCYYNKCIFICDCSNKRIQRLTDNLVYEASVATTNNPQYIKNINNIAMVRPRNEQTISFYDLDTFILLKRLDGHNGVIGVSKSYFYEYYPTNKIFYCYNKNGEFVEQFQTNGFGFGQSNDWGSICKVKSRLYLTSYGSNFLSYIS